MVGRSAANPSGALSRDAERREIEKELWASRARLQQLLASSPAVLYTTEAHPPHGTTFIGDNIEVQSGYAAAEFLRDPRFWEARIHPDDRESAVAALASLGARDEVTFEYRFRVASGDYRWMRDQARVVRDENGRAVEIVGFCSDITDRKLAEQALQRSEQHFRHLIEKATDLVGTVDLMGVFTYLSPAVQAMLEFKPEELVGRNAFDLVHPDDVERVLTVFSTAIAEGRTARAEYRYAHKNGSWRWLESSGWPETDDRGNTIGAIINSRDVTERREAARALENAHAFRKAIEDSVTAGLVVTDAEGRLTYVNRAMCGMTDYRESELIGATAPFPYWAPEDREARLAWFKRLLGGEFGDRPNGYEARLMKRNGDRFDALVLPSAVNHPDGTRGWLAAIHDITEKKRLETEFREAQKMEAIGRLAGGVAHDFNNLLTAILGYAELALESMPQGDPLRVDLNEIRKAGESAASLTRQLLAFSRHQVFQPAALNLNTVVTEMTRILGRVIGEDVRLVTALESHLPFVNGDRGQIEQVIMNLAVNARDAMPSGGALVIQTAARSITDPHATGWPELTPGDYVVLAVSDTGHGMNAVTRGHLFEPFFTTKERGRGTGLGLATIYGIVKQCGGHVLVDTRVGWGTSFIVFLPTAKDAVAEVARTAPSRPAGGRGEVVLLVEDDDAIRALAEHVLTQHGYDVRVARTAEEAIGIVDSMDEPVGLLLTDVVMPGRSGTALAARLRERQPSMRCLFMSGYTDDALKHHGVEWGGGGYIQKPFRPAALLQKVREELDGPVPAKA